MTRINNTGRVGTDFDAGQGGGDAKANGTGLSRSNARRGSRTSSINSENMAPRRPPRRSESAPAALGRLEGKLANGYEANFGEQGRAPALARRAESALERGFDGLNQSPSDHLSRFEGKLERGYDRLFSKSGGQRLEQLEQKLADGHDQVFGKPPEQHLDAARQRLGAAAGQLLDGAHDWTADVQHTVMGDSSSVTHAFQTLVNGNVGDAATNFSNLSQAVQKSEVMNMSTEQLGQAVSSGLDSAGKSISSAASNAAASLSAWWNKS